MQQAIRQYAPEDMGGNGTNEDKDTLNEVINGGTGTAGDIGSIGTVGDTPGTNEPMNTDEGNTDNTDGSLSDDDGVLFITEDILVTTGFPSPVTSSRGRNSNGKTALITGASSGIGRELANLFAQDGYDLVLVARSEDSLLEIADEYEQQFGIQATVISRDLADPSAPDEIYAETLLQGIQVDVLVNNAGIGEYGRFATESDLEKELDLIQINSVSLVHLTKLFVKDMVARNEGKILLLGSVASVMPHPMMAIYGATKAFNYSFGESLRNELKDTNIAVTVLMPPPTDTDFFNKAGASHTVAQHQAHSMTPAEVAKAGYEALMADKDKVAPGLSAKLQIASGFLLPDSVNAQNIRNLMKDRNEVAQDKKMTLTMAVAVGAALLGGWWLLSRSRTNGAVDAYEKAKVKTKAGLAKRSAKKALSNGLGSSSPLESAADSVRGVIYETKNAAERVVDKVLA